MKIKKNILIWQWGRRGGGPKYTLELCKELSKRKEFALFVSISEQCEIIQDFKKLKVNLSIVSTYNNLSSALMSSFNILKVRSNFWNYVKINKIELIICTMSHIWNVPMLIGRNKSIPYLLVVHDAKPHPGDDVYLRHFLLKVELKNADGLIALTNHVKNIIKKQLKIDISSMNVIPHGVFQYSKALTMKSTKLKKILFFGRILPYKGIKNLLIAYKKVKKIDKTITLVIVGPGDLSSYNKLIDQLDDVFIQNSWIPEDEIEKYFQDAYIVVLPYIEASQSGVIPIAYSAAVPAVITPIGGLVEQVINNKTGIICKGNDSDAIAEGLIKLIQNKKLYYTCVKGATDYANSELSWTSIAQKFTNIIKLKLRN